MLARLFVLTCAVVALSEPVGAQESDIPCVAYNKSRDNAGFGTFEYCLRVKNDCSFNVSTTIDDVQNVKRSTGLILPGQTGKVCSNYDFLNLGSRRLPY